MNTIITSIITSSAVSILTFILGLKSGKSQTDRAFLQEKYKLLYAHFSELEVGIKEKNPKKWEDFKRMQQGSTCRYYPPVRELESTGDILYIKESIAKTASGLELDCLSYKSKLDELCVKMHEHLINCSELYKGELIDASYDKRQYPLKKINTVNPTECKTYRLFPYSILLDKEILINTLDERDASNDKYALDFVMSGNPPEKEFVIYPHSLEVNNIIFAERICEFANSEINCIDTEKELLKRIGKLKKKLAKRAKNPTGFWETFVGAFIDIIC